MATLAISDVAKDDLNRIAKKSILTALRLINRLQSWAQTTPPLPNGSSRLDMSIAAQYQRQCTVDQQDFTIVFVYPHGTHRRFMVVGVYPADEFVANTGSDHFVEDDIYEIDN